MKINPFILTNRIPDKYFCDREVETNKLISCIENQENVVLTAQRRIGKTGLINHCFDDKSISNNYYTISLDILHTASLREMVQDLGNVAFKAVAKRSDRMLKIFSSVLKSVSASFGYDPLTATPTFDIRLGAIDQPSFTLDEIFEFLEKADKPCIVAIDEFQQILKYPEKNIEEILRGKIQRLVNTHFIFAGSERRIMSEMFFSEKRPFYQSATSIMLEPIQKDKYVAFAEKQFSESEMLIDPVAITYAYDLFEGITMHVHRVLHDAYAATCEHEKFSLEDMKLLCKSYVQECGYRLKEMMGNISESQKELLYAISEERQATSITSSAFVKKHHLKSASSAQSAAKKLVSADLITKTGNVYTVSDPMLRIWIEQDKLD